MDVLCTDKTGTLNRKSSLLNPACRLLAKIFHIPPSVGIPQFLFQTGLKNFWMSLLLISSKRNPISLINTIPVASLFNKVDEISIWLRTPKNVCRVKLKKRIHLDFKRSCRWNARRLFTHLFGIKFYERFNWHQINTDH